MCICSLLLSVSLKDLLYARKILLWQDYVRCVCAVQYNILLWTNGMSVYGTQCTSGIWKYGRERQNGMTNSRSHLVWRDLALLCYHGPECWDRPKERHSQPYSQKPFTFIGEHQNHIQGPKNTKTYTFSTSSNAAAQSWCQFVGNLANSLWVPRCFYHSGFWFMSKTGKSLQSNGIHRLR